MSILLGYDYWGSVFQDDSPSLNSMKYNEFSGAIVDEIDIREKTDKGMNNVKDTWQKDSILISQFKNTLEAGNLSNDGVKIVKFEILRRLAKQDYSDDIHLGEVPYIAGTSADLEFVDVSQPNDDLIYSLIPMGENGLAGSLKEVSISSDFTGVWIVDKDTGEALAFDKAIGSVGNVDVQLNQDRTVLDTFGNYQQFYYSPKQFESFTLSTVIFPDDGERSTKKYKDIVRKFISDHKPKIVKTDNGKILVADISNIRTSTPLNTWENFDYMTIQVDVTECYDYEKFMKGEQINEYSLLGSI